MQEIWFALLGILSLLVVSPGSPEAAAPHPMLADAQTVLQITKDDRILGNPEAPITIVEYASLTCPHCAHFANDVLPEIKKAWIDTGKAKLVLRDFPLDEPALRAAMIARCAPPDRYYAFADTFFAGQARRYGQGGVRHLPQKHRAREQNRRRTFEGDTGARSQFDSDILCQWQ